MNRVLASVLAVFVSLPVLAQSKVYVLDGGARSIARVDAQRGVVEQKVTLPLSDKPAQLVASPDGKHLLVLAEGKLNASAAIVDAATLTSSATIDLGRGIGDAVFTRDGKSVIVLSPGPPAALFRIDLATGAVAKKLQFDRMADQFGAVDGQTGVVFHKAGKSTNAHVSFVALDALEVTASIDLTGKAAELVELPGSGYLYAVEGSAIDVVSVAGRKLAATLSIGRDAKLGGFDEATRTLFVTAVDDQKNGILYAVRGAEIVANATTGSGRPETFRLSADGTRAFISNSRGVNPVTLAPSIAPQPAAPLFSGMTANSLHAVDAAVSPDASRVFLLMQQNGHCCTLAIADPAAATKIGSVKVGRNSRRIAQALLSLGATAASFSAARADAQAHGHSTFYYSVYSPAWGKNPRGAFAFSPDAKTIYVPDSGTDTVTAVDVETGKRIADLDAPSDVAEVMRLGKTIVARSETGVALLDSASNTVAASLDAHGLVVSPDATMALALGKGDVAVIDGRTATVTAHVAGLADPVTATFAP